MGVADHPQFSTIFVFYFMLFILILVTIILLFFASYVVPKTYLTLRYTTMQYSAHILSIFSEKKRIEIQISIFIFI